MAQKQDAIMTKPIADHQLRRRVRVNCSEPVLTDQSQTPMAEINNIMAQYTRTGMLPGIPNQQMTYVDDVNAPRFMDAHEQMTKAKLAFASLPTPLKNELNNDYRKFETWLSDPENKDRAIKYGLLKKPEPESSSPKSNPPKVEAEPTPQTT